MSRGPADSFDMSVHAGKPREFIAIGIPSFGMVHLFFVARLLSLRMPMNRVIRWFYVVNKEVGEARNEIVAKALAADDLHCSHVFFLDDDVLFHPDVLLKLLAHNRPIVSGLYYTKTSVPTPLVLRDEGEGTHSWTPGELVECAGHGMGLTLINADVFRVLEAEGLPTDPHGYPAWFQTVRDQVVLAGPGAPAGIRNVTEDVHFLQQARARGFQPAVDTSAQAFGWHFDAKRLQGYPMKQWAEWHEHGRVTWETETGAVTWEQVA